MVSFQFIQLCCPITKIYLYIQYHYEQYKIFWTCMSLCVSVQYVILDQCSIYNSIKPLNIIQILHAVYIYEQNQKAFFFTLHHLEDDIHHWPAMSHIQNTAQKDFNFFFIYTSQATTLSTYFFSDNPTNISSKFNYCNSTLPGQKVIYRDGAWASS